MPNKSHLEKIKDLDPNVLERQKLLSMFNNQNNDDDDQVQ